MSDLEPYPLPDELAPERRPDLWRPCEDPMFEFVTTDKGRQILNRVVLDGVAVEDAIEEAAGFFTQGGRALLPS